MPAPIPDPRPDEEQPPGGACGPAGQPPAGGAPGPAGERPAGDAPRPGGEPPADGGPGAGGEQEGGQRWGGPGWAWADTGPVPEYQRPGIQPEVAAGGGLPAGLDYQALLDALAAAGVVNNNPEDQDAEFDEWLAAGQEGRLEPADPARVAAVAVEHMDPGPAQGGWLGVAAGGADRLDESALAGVAVASRQLTSWGQACELGALAPITAPAAAADRTIGVDADGRPARVSRDAVGQVEMALRLTHYGAEARADLAVTLAWRLRATGAALAAGRVGGVPAQLLREGTNA